MAVRDPDQTVARVAQCESVARGGSEADARPPGNAFDQRLARRGLVVIAADELLRLSLIHI